MINSIKLLKSKNSPCDVCKYDGDKSCDASGGEFGECKPAEELFKALREALLALEQKEKLKQEVTYQLDQIIYTDKIKEDIRRSVWKEVLELMK
jgi:hypothetical protein